MIAYNSGSIILRAPHSGEMHFAGLGMGIEPHNYPLAGPLTIGEPAGAALADLLRQTGNVVITRDIALEYGLKVGDSLVLADLRAGLPMTGRVRGIAYDTPNHQGDKVYYTIKTAQALAGGLPVVNTVIAKSALAGAASAELNGSGWAADWVGGRRSENTGNAWVTGLRAAAILGLLVGGIGIANTMQVLLRRRQREIAIWKTIGYRAGHLRLLFTLEAGLLGLSGSLCGAGLGALVSGLVLELIRRMSTVLYRWTFSPAPILKGVLIGTFTTVIFAAWAIAASSQARPAALLRSERDDANNRPGCHPAGFGLLLAAPFTVMAGLVMESAAAGIGVLVLVGMGIAGLGGFFSVLLWAGRRVLPLRSLPLLRMVAQSLRGRGGSLVFAMVAIFIGVMAMSLGLAVGQFSEMRIPDGPAGWDGYNLTILADAAQESAVRRAVAALDPLKVGVGYRAALDELSTGSLEPAGLDPVLVGRSDPQDYILNGAEWGSRLNGVYVPAESDLKVGSQVKAALRGGAAQTFTVVGTYQINHGSNNLLPPAGLLTTLETFTRTGEPDSVTYFVQLAPEQAGGAEANLTAALPQAVVVDLVSYAGRYMHAYRKLYVLPLALAGLALLAGCLLVANSVSLAMLDRRYEIGMLKAVGYTRRQVLSIFAVEYGLAGLLAAGTGVLLILALLGALALANNLPAAVLVVSLRSLVLVTLSTAGLILLTVFGVTWRPSQVSPVVLLTERE